MVHHLKWPVACIFCIVVALIQAIADSHQSGTSIGQRNGPGTTATGIADTKARTARRNEKTNENKNECSHGNGLSKKLANPTSLDKAALRQQRGR